MRIMMALMLSIVAWSQAPRLDACTCKLMPLEEHVELSALVARVRVTSVRIEPPMPDPEVWDAMSEEEQARLMVMRRREGQVVAEVEVLECWKGCSTRHVSIRTGMGGGDCGEHFVEGEEYLLFAYGAVAPGLLSTNTCSGTRPVDDAAEWLAYLGTPRPDELLDSSEDDPAPP